MIRIALSVVLAIATLGVFDSRDVAGEDSLANGGFEAGTSSWIASHRQLEAMGAPLHAGDFAGRLMSHALPEHEVYQWAPVSPAQAYRFGGWLRSDDPNVRLIYLRITWFDDGGNLIGPTDSTHLTGEDPAYRALETGSTVSPVGAASARLGIRVLPFTVPFSVRFDDFYFEGPATVPIPEITPPPPTPSATPKPTSPPSPSSPTPSPQPDVTPTPVPGEEPSVFNTLVNGGFEVARSDGTPYGWRKQGGEMRVASSPRYKGNHSAVLSSSTTSTKWIYQTVAVTPGVFYEATASALTSEGSGEVFARVSWYTSADGSGSALESADSAPSLGGSSFRPLATGAIQAPADTSSAKVRLMFRPSSATALAYFDAVTFAATSPQPNPGHPDPTAGNGRPPTDIGPTPPPHVRAGSAGDAPELPPATGVLSNVKPEREPPPPLPASKDSGRPDWAIALALVGAAAAVCVWGATEWWSRARARDR